MAPPLSKWQNIIALCSAAEWRYPTNDTTSDLFTMAVPFFESLSWVIFGLPIKPDMSYNLAECWKGYQSASNGRKAFISLVAHSIYHWHRFLIAPGFIHVFALFEWQLELRFCTDKMVLMEWISMIIIARLLSKNSLCYTNILFKRLNSKISMHPYFRVWLRPSTYFYL